MYRNLLILPIAISPIDVSLRNSFFLILLHGNALSIGDLSIHYLRWNSFIYHLSYMIEIENLTKKFGNLTAVDSISMNIDEGEVFGFLGPNGAGKTTTVRMLCTLISKTRGNARIAGYDISNKNDALKIRKIIGLVPDNVGLSEHTSADDKNREESGTAFS